MNYVDKSDKMATAEVQVNKRMKYFLIKRQYGVEGLTCNSGNNLFSTLCLQCYNGNNSTVHKVTGRLHEKEISEPPLQVHCLFCFFNQPIGGGNKLVMNQNNSNNKNSNNKNICNHPHDGSAFWTGKSSAVP
jgi:hypothetical protein